MINTVKSVTPSQDRRQFLSMSLAGSLGALVNPGFGASANRKPNILVIYTDDHGWADLGVQQAVADIKTPHIDALARSGAMARSGYSTAPQCVPSRAGLMTGKYQERFGVESNPLGPLPLDVPTLAERLAPAGYCCGHVGKWHLSPNRESRRWLAAGGHSNIQAVDPESLMKYQPHRRGFHEYFSGERARYYANYTLDGQSLPEPTSLLDGRYRIDVQTDGALAFIRRNKEKPFFLYLAYYGPHVPLETPENYLQRFPGPMPERRRHALGCLSAIDDGVGKVVAELRELELENHTLVFFISDNGAPLHHKIDSPPNTEPGGWDGSLNDPWLGEKGMLAEGGIRVPFIVNWPGHIPPGTIREPLSTLDVGATACSLAGIRDGTGLDGMNLLPVLTGNGSAFQERALFWRWGTQAAVRKGRWKMIRLGTGREMLFDLESDQHEKRDLATTQAEKCRELRTLLANWAEGLSPKGLPNATPSAGEQKWYAEHFGIAE